MNHEHSWTKREDWTVCRHCGVVRNDDRPDSQCRGAAKIALREATGGEQGESAEILEIARLRRELDEARTDISVLRDDRDRIRAVSAEALESRDRLSTIVDEAFGVQEVLGVDGLLARLERLLTERALQSSGVRRELAAAREKISKLRRELKEWREWADRRSSWSLLFAERPPDAEIRTMLGELLDVATGEEMARVHGERATALMDLEAAKRELGEALAKLELIDDHRRADSDQISRLETALRDLIDSADASMTRDTSVLCDIDAARAVLGGRS